MDSDGLITNRWFFVYMISRMNAVVLRSDSILMPIFAFRIHCQRFMSVNEQTAICALGEVVVLG